MRQVTRKGLMTMAAASGVLAAAGGAAHADAGAQGSATHSPGVLSGNTVQAPVESEVNVCGNTVSVVGLLNPAAGNKCSNGGGGKHARGGQGGGHGSSYGGSHADGGAHGSPGVASGNHVQAPVHVPVNVCGNTVDVVGVANPATGNDCSNGGGGGGGGYGDHGHGGHGPSYDGSHADGHTGGSPGVGSGNSVQVPIDVPVNLCGNSISVIGLGNGVTGNDCGNGGGAGAHENPGGGDSEEASPQTPDKPVRPGDEIPRGDTNTPGTQTVDRPDGLAQLAQTGGDLPLGLVLPMGAGALIGGALIYRKARAAAL
ncbi:chaplin [Streptomyces scabiei]|uniref:chaplin n=1 Tax=Streptomyces scabiei TaxID=1930 RepID=UPI00340EB6CE